LNKSLPHLEVHTCIKGSDELKNLFTGQLQSKLTGLMIAQELGNMNETLRMIKELDELTYSVLSNSSCSEVNEIAFLKNIKDKYPILAINDSLSFNSTDNITIDISATPQLIAKNNKKLITEQAAANSTEDKTQYMYRMGEQLGLATKLY